MTFPWVGREGWALIQTTTSARITTLCAVKCATNVNNGSKVTNNSINCISAYPREMVGIDNQIRILQWYIWSLISGLLSD